MRPWVLKASRPTGFLLLFYSAALCFPPFQFRFIRSSQSEGAVFHPHRLREELDSADSSDAVNDTSSDDLCQVPIYLFSFNFLFARKKRFSKTSVAKQIPKVGPNRTFAIFGFCLATDVFESRVELIIPLGERCSHGEESVKLAWPLPHWR